MVKQRIKTILWIPVWECYVIERVDYSKALLDQRGLLEEVGPEEFKHLETILSCSPYVTFSARAASIFD